MGGDISFVDAQDVTAPGNEDFVALSAEPKLNTAASVASGYQFTDEASEKSVKEVEWARKQTAVNKE